MGLGLGETFPADAANKLGVKGKDAVVYFYGADGSPSCTKEAAAFDEKIAEFKQLKFEVVGVRSEKESKGEFEQRYSQRFVADADNSVRKQLDIKGDFFGFLAGRETYVIDTAGTVKLVFNSQFKPEEHVDKALEAAQLIAASRQSGRQGSFFSNFRLPSLGGLGSMGGGQKASPAAPAPAPAARKPVAKVVAAKPARGGLRSTGKR